MGTLFLILILVGAALSTVTGARALKAWLRLRRTRRAFQTGVAEEVDRLAARTEEIQRSLSAVESRAQELPVRIADLQQSLATLRILTNALSTSVRQAQRALSYTGARTLSAERIADLIGRDPLKRLRRLLTG